jgi:hypothetical protein
MRSKDRTSVNDSPATTERAMGAILEFLSSDGDDEELHVRSLAAIRFLEDNRSPVTEVHKMRMAVVARRSDRITAKLRDQS